MGVEVVIGRVVKGFFETVLTTTGRNLVRKHSALGYRRRRDEG